MAKNKAYRAAERKIEQALRSGAAELDLSPDWDTGEPERLTELPESLRGLTNLRSLDLSYHRLRALPSWIGELTHLENLDLSENELASLPDSFRGLEELKALWLGSIETGNPLKVVPDPIRLLRKP